MSNETEYQKLQEIGESAYDCIAEMVAALECDYERLRELREARDDLRAEFDAEPTNAGDFMNWVRNQHSLTSDDVDELIELEKAAGDCESREDAERRIQEDALCVEVRTGWREIWRSGDNIAPEEFCILLGTGGPAVRIRGELRDGEPYRAWLETQDWGTPWTEYRGGDSETLLTYCRCFYFGEG